MMRNRSGFTAIEMALVTTIMGLVTAIAYPRLASVRDQGALESARRHVITQLAGARASAIQRGQAVRLRTVGSSVWLTTEIGGAQTAISPTSELEITFGVRLTASHDPVIFDSRGYATSLPVTGATFVLERGALRDSVCITQIGTVIAECGL